MHSDQIIYDYFFKLRNDIDIDREKIKLLIDEHYLKLIDEVNEIEATCAKESVDKLAKFSKLIDEEVKKSNEKYKILRADIDMLEINFENWENIRHESNLNIDKLEEIAENLKRDYLMNKSYEYESKPLVFEATKIIMKEMLPIKSLVNFIKLNNKI